MQHNSQEQQVLISIRQIIRATDIYSRKLSKEVGLTAPQLLILQENRHKTKSGHLMCETRKDVFLCAISLQFKLYSFVREIFTGKIQSLLKK